MELVMGSVEMSDGARLENVTVSLVKRPRGSIAVSGWGGVFKCTRNVQIELFRDHKLVLDDGRSGIIQVVHVSSIGDGLLALFRGVGPMVESPPEPRRGESGRNASDDWRGGEGFKAAASYESDVTDETKDVEGLALVEIG
jgi:hypothetical protein